MPLSALDERVTVVAVEPSIALPALPVLPPPRYIAGPGRAAPARPRSFGSPDVPRVGAT